MDSKDNRYVLLVIAATMAWGAVGVFVMRLGDRGINVFDISLVRTAVCLVGMAVLLYITDRAGFRICGKDVPFFILVGAAKVICIVTMSSALMEIPISLASVLQMTAPYYVMVFALFLFGEKITRKNVLAVCMAFVGCVIVSDVVSGSDPYGLMGSVLAMVSAVFEAVNVIGTKISVGRGYSVGSYVLYSNLFATLFLMVIVAFLGDFGSIARVVCSGLPAIADILMLGIVCTLVPLMLQATALKHLSAGIVSALGMMEIVFAALFGLVLGQDVTPVNIVGMGFIIASLLFMGWKPRPSESPDGAVRRRNGCSEPLVARYNSLNKASSCATTGERMGRIRPTYIKRVSIDLVNKYPDAFNQDFENNKQMVGKLTDVEYVPMRNKIAGYITRYLQHPEA